MDRRASRSSDIDLYVRRNLESLSPVQLLVSINCNPVQLLAMAINEASVIPSQFQMSNFCILEQLTAMEMMLASVNMIQLITFSDCNPVQ